MESPQVSIEKGSQYKPIYWF